MPTSTPTVTALLTDARTGDIATPAQVAARFPGATPVDAEFGVWDVPAPGGWIAALDRDGEFATTTAGLDVYAEMP